VLEGIAAASAAGEAGGEDHAVVGQGGGRGAVLLAGGAEGEQDGGAGDRGAGGERERVAGVVVEPGQDLGAGPAGEGLVGEVGLPALAGQLGGEPDVGRLRPFGRVGGDQSLAGQDSADGRRGDLQLVVLLQVPGDGLRPASSPCPASSLRKATMSSTVPGLVADGEFFGRRDRGSDAASPSAS
jgi:hypothetical protein